MLRTNLTPDSAADLWKKYMQLTEVEAALRTLKSELAIRPLFHQLEKRMKAHVLVAFLGYAQNCVYRKLHAMSQCYTRVSCFSHVVDFKGVQTRPEFWRGTGLEQKIEFVISCQSQNNSK